MLLFSCSVVSLCNSMDFSTPGFPVLHHLWVGSNSCPLSWWCHPTIYLILCHPLLLLPSIILSIRVFSNELAVYIRWPKYWSFSFSNSPSNEYSGLISFRIDWFDLLAVKGILKRLLQFESISSSVLSLLYGSTLISMCDYWKIHSLDYMDLFQQSNV